MPIKLKLDANGNAVLQDGKPVCVHEDGKEFVHDVNAAVTKINNFAEERDRHTAKYKELETKFQAYEGIDPEQAREALDTVSNLKNKQLMDAEGVKAVKTEMRKTFDAEKQQMVESFENEKKKIQGERESDKSLIYKLMVKNKFSSSEFFAGEKPKTIYPPKDAAKIFGDYFKVEGDGEEATVVAYKDGKPILSRTNHGEPADFNEAIGIIIDQDPDKHRYLNTQKGTRYKAGGNTGDHDDKDAPKSGVDRIKQGLAKRMQAAG
jgi:hypothetical protein